MLFMCINRQFAYKTNKWTDIKIIFYSEFAINLTYFDPSWSSSENYWTSLKHIYKNRDWFINYIKFFPPSRVHYNQSEGFLQRM